jgi:hypothetical protein
VDELTLTLPSGRTVSVRRRGEGAPVADDRALGARMFSGRLVNAVASGRCEITPEGDGAQALDERALLSLRLSDYHAIRDAAWRVGAIALEPTDLVCRNCDTPFTPAPEDAPLEDLDRWYLEGAEPVAGPFPLPSPIVLPDGSLADEVSAHEVTVEEALPLLRAVVRSNGIRVSKAVVRALGIDALGETRDRGAMARALEDASDDAWAAIETLFLLLNYSPKASFPVVCASCGALHDVDAPPTRELELDPVAAETLLGEREPREPLARDEELAPFPDEDAFAELALHIGREVYREMGVKNVELEVVFDTPPVDGSGEPLLGSYQPMTETDLAGYTTLGFLIQVYYRTFERMYEDEPYDVPAELRETIEHEVEHHLNHLRGHDPMDEEEREEAAREVARTFGRRAVRRAEVRAVVEEARGLGRFVLGALVVLGAIIVFLWLTGRL